MAPPQAVFSLLLVHLVATATMFGVIWQVQLLTYPQFAEVGTREFPGYHEAHCRRILRVVAPLMLIELVCAAALVPLLWDSPLRLAALAGIVLLAFVWLSTAALQMPQHRQLAAGWDADGIAALVRGNWIRVVGWSLRLGIAAWLVVRWVGMVRT